MPDTHAIEALAGPGMTAGNVEPETGAARVGPERCVRLVGAYQCVLPPHNQVSIGEGVARRRVSASTHNGAHTRFVLLFLRSFPIDQTRRWPFPSRKQTASKKRLASREIVPAQRRRSILSRCQKRTQKQRGTKFGTSHARKEKGEKSDPWVRVLVK